MNEVDLSEGLPDRDPLDPSPRTYPDMVSLLRRGAFDRGALQPLSVQKVETWLLDEAGTEPGLLELFQSFVWRLVASGLPLERASLHVGTLHPQLFGYAWNWNVDDGFCDEVKVDEAVLATDAYRRNPLFRVIERGERFRARIDEADRSNSTPLLAELGEQGITEYAALPMSAGAAYHNAATVATRRKGGFTDRQFQEIERLLRLLALHVERHIASRISENIVTTYLGEQAGHQVLSGSIKRGSGTAIEAIIWASDMRDFTSLADRLDDQDLTGVLNAYFDRLAGAVMDHGGEVLKFIGDGLLSVFPFENFENEEETAAAAINAAEAALAAIDDLNADSEALQTVSGWRPLQTGIALHRGRVFFGNVGAPKRLDFTVIGKAVNAVSRVESLCKTTGRALLVTQDVRDLSNRRFDHLGAFELKGIEHPIPIYALSGNDR